MKALRQWFRKIAQPFLWAAYRWYLSKPRWYTYRGIKVRVLPSVFHPGWLISTKVLLDFALKQKLKNRKVLELGAGSGLLALAAVRVGAVVTASDINPHAIQSIQESSKINRLPLTIIESDLFQQISPQSFDYIFINPPYYPQQAQNHREQAFYCGANFEYFQELFDQLPAYLANGAKAHLILSEDCEIAIIQQLASERKLVWQLVKQIKKAGEQQFIFSLGTEE